MYPTQRDVHSRSHGRRRRRAVHVLAALTLGLAGALVSSSPAQAADGPFEVSGSTGTIPDAGATQLTDTFGNVKELGPKNSNTTKIGVINRATSPMLDLTNPNAQVDLRRAWVASSKEAGKDWLYFAWERDANSGSGFIAYEFMQSAAPSKCDYTGSTPAELVAGCNPWANRQAGDFMILWDQSGSSTNLSLRVWSGTAPNLTLGPAQALDATVSQAAYSADHFRGEAALNLTDTIFHGATSCRTFANIIPSTVTGNSDTADYKDTILQPSVPVGNCTSGTVTTPVQSDGTTAITSDGVASGSSVRDSAVVSLTGGTAVPDGSVSFYLCKVDSPTLCDSDGTPVGTAQDLTGTAYPATVVSDAVTVTDPGRYCFAAYFTGDTSHGIPASQDSTSGECFTVNAVPTTASTEQSWVPNDSITVSASAGGDLDGTATFDLYSTTDCTGPTVIDQEQVPVSGAAPQTVSTTNETAVPAGTYSWKASYTSDNASQLGITASCKEVSTLTVDDDNTTP